MPTFYPGQTDYILQLNGLVAGGAVTYATGSFSPVLAGQTTSGAGTYSVQAGRYTHTGNRVDFQAIMTVTAHTGTGIWQMSNLPFVSDNTMPVGVICRIANGAFTGTIDAFVAAGTSTVVLPNFNFSSPMGSPPVTFQITGNYQG